LDRLRGKADRLWNDLDKMWVILDRLLPISDRILKSRKVRNLVTLLKTVIDALSNTNEYRLPIFHVILI
jgi:hypothetical protein